MKRNKIAFDYEEIIDSPIICYSLEQACKALKVYCEYEVVNVKQIHFRIKTRDIDLLEQVFIVADREYRSEPNPIHFAKWLIFTRAHNALNFFTASL